jgi:glucose-6-phosphate 1-dehydrogenase
VILERPCILVILGASGDLTHRKLIPALFNLYLDQQLPEKFAILGLDHKSWEQDSFQQSLHKGVDEFSRRGPADPESWSSFVKMIHFYSGDFTKPDCYTQLASHLKLQVEQWSGKADYIFYLATSPFFIETIISNLNKASLLTKKSASRVVIEKPFGHDLPSAIKLNETLQRVLDESQIFRIDHFLGKETVQNILALRFANSLFEPLWNRTYIDHIQITVAEQIGIEHRGTYYDSAGALRDMLENHLFQLLGLIAMEAPSSFDQEEIRNKKVDVIKAIRPISKELVSQVAVRGQYAKGNINGQPTVDYRSEPGVAKESTTETFVALKLFVDNWRWQDVPFYLRTGKRLAQRVAEITLQFRDVPHRSFPSAATESWQPNHLTIQIQPEEEISIRFQAKQPGTSFELKPVDMKFSYRESFLKQSPEAYETLLLDILEGDTTSFVRGDLEKAAWLAVSPILDVWKNTRPSSFPNYTAGSWGPRAAEDLIVRDGRNWYHRA